MTDQPGPTQPPQRGRGTGRAEFRAQVQSTKADIERQVQATRAQLDATNERIEARTGRNLILATLIGLVLGGAMLVSLIFIKELFMIVAFVVVGFTAFELAEALRRGGRKVPRIPVLLSAVAVVPAAFYWGAGGQWLATLGGVLLITLWRLAMLAFPRHRAPRRLVLADIGGGFLIQVYVVFLSSFAVLLVTQDGGQWWTLRSFFW